MVSQTETRAGEVTRVSGYGFQLNGQARWYNLSKFVTGLALPAVGEVVEISLSRGYVVQIARRADPPAGEPGSAPALPPPTTSQAPAPVAETTLPPVAETDQLPFEPLVEPPFLDPDALPFDEPSEDAEEASPAAEVEWELGPAGALVSPSPPEKDLQMVRMNAITNAVAILSSGGRTCAVDDVLALAARLEAWVRRPG